MVKDRRILSPLRLPIPPRPHLNLYGADNGHRTRIFGLEDRYSTIELYLHLVSPIGIEPISWV